MFCSTLNTPIGLLIIKATTEALEFIGYDLDDVEENPGELTEYVKGQLQEYFDGKRSIFDLPLQQAGTDFQRNVWNELLKIEPGKPISYAALSKRMNNPLAIRAIASANGKNKLMIVIPCHRVIGSGGELVGYAGGLWRKKWLLEHEARMMNTGQATLMF
ncbi:methylated-DNA--[protein]-cysteine S-methyltransferase [Paradesertivirga mongoliensis]|uniref:Methylated-DNA--[protein]-cysteine S-methyltransferase n=1 Tax=Paradesertivirga mongoliensis TaxID=2100740 RepID=A0ABW4ZPL2_9SPHI|nr:methylated-DNA--[protein]-cysteine S-methyltransferase [Pedobacter mongoliensis]